jgi:protein O-GlcNAc transferase
MPRTVKCRDRSVSTAQTQVWPVRVSSPPASPTDLRRRSAVSPDDAALHHTLALGSHEGGAYHDAYLRLRRATSLGAADVNLLNRLSRLASVTSRSSIARRFAERLVASVPGNADALTQLGFSFQSFGDLTAAAAAYRRALACDVSHPLAHLKSMVVESVRPQIDRHRLRQEHVRLASRWTKAQGPRGPGRSLGSSRGRPLTIAYLGASVFERSTLGCLLWPVLAHHDRSSATVVYYTETDLAAIPALPGSTIRRSYRNLDGAALAEQLRRDQVDIAVDLSGMGDANRLDALAFRPAPVQVTWLGYWGTTGLKEIDFVLLDGTSAPPEVEVDYEETIFRLPDGRFCYAPPSATPDVEPPPARSRGFITYGSFNSPVKLGDDVLRTWAALLGATRDARLLIVGNAFDDAVCSSDLVRRLDAAGADLGRIEIRAPRGRMMDEYASVDVCLDPFPYTGGITSLETLWMGVPLVTLAGDRVVSRQGTCFLTQLQQPGWIAKTTGDYVDIALSLSADVGRLADLRSRQRQRMLASTLCDGPRFARNVEAAYRRMWEMRVERA